MWGKRRGGLNAEGAEEERPSASLRAGRVRCEENPRAQPRMALPRGLLTMAQDVARNRSYEAGFDLVVTAIQRGSYFGELRKVAGHGVFD